MKTRLGIAIAVAVLGLAVPASADTVANFTLDGVAFDDGGTATRKLYAGFGYGHAIEHQHNDHGAGLYGTTYTGASGPFGSTSFTNSPASFEFAYFDVLYQSNLAINLASALTPSDLMSPNALIRISNGQTLWFQKFHHIIIDATGRRLLSSGTAARYRALLCCDHDP